jgi:uncharacterized LabA/DUF88 family protein
MPNEPVTKRAIAFIDGQNLFHAAKDAFGYTYPNYDAGALARSVCASQGWDCVGVQFYTGVPEATDHAFWNAFWNAKLAAMGTRGIRVFRRALRYRNQTVRLPDGRTHTFLVGQEKGVDIRLALDVVHACRAGLCDVALVFSQDQDLSEVAEEVRAIAAEQERWFKIVSAFPLSPASSNRRGVNKTDWIRIDRALYDQCLDPVDYRPAPH